MKYYAFIKNNQINGVGQCPILNDDILNYDVTEEIYNNIDHYIWNGSDVVINPNYEQEHKQKEREQLSQLSLTKREVFLALYRDKGVTPDQIKNQVTDPEALIEFEYATEYYRGNPLIDSIGALLGYSSDDLDYLFVHKELRNDSVVQ